MSIKYIPNYPKIITPTNKFYPETRLPQDNQSSFSSLDSAVVYQLSNNYNSSDRCRNYDRFPKQITLNNPKHNKKQGLYQCNNKNHAYSTNKKYIQRQSSPQQIQNNNLRWQRKIKEQNLEELLKQNKLFKLQLQKLKKDNRRLQIQINQKKTNNYGEIVNRKLKNKNNQNKQQLIQNRRQMHNLNSQQVLNGKIYTKYTNNNSAQQYQQPQNLTQALKIIHNLRIQNKLINNKYLGQKSRVNYLQKQMLELKHKINQYKINNNQQYKTNNNQFQDASIINNIKNGKKCNTNNNQYTQSQLILQETISNNNNRSGLIMKSNKWQQNFIEVFLDMMKKISKRQKLDWNQEVSQKKQTKIGWKYLKSIIFSNYQLK